ncbi:MAG: DUF2779 domain-containing protein, partial [Candidatus Omnitrophica bacterium]|nr:DUF2779 domain-containing protein [Candidatus Omnitrophota bacterium]
PEPDAAKQAIFDQGNRVGEMARKLFPDGIKLEREQMPEKMHAKSMEAAKLRKPLFEAGLTYGRAYALPDILVPVGKDEWDLVEVKSGAEVKEEHYPDVAFQKYVYTGAGLNIRKCFLMHIDNKYIRMGEIEPEKLFKKEDITKEIKPYGPGLERSIKEMLKVISGKEPKVKIGPQCGKPYGCPLEELCWGFLPADDIFQLRGKKAKLFDLLDEGILKITDIPIEDWLSENQLIQIKSHQTGKAHVDREEIGEFLGELKYPLYFLDFETLSSAIPPYDLTHPFENIFFQFSLHVIPKEGAKPVHHGYLAPGDTDPRPELLKRLKALLGDKGTILAYSMSFEIGCLEDAAEAYPEYKSWFEELRMRFADLLVPFRKFYYYHPAQGGSCSLKDVLPAMTKTSYEGMEIADGGTASREYERVTFGDNIDEKDRQQVRAALEEYCQLDTQAMIDILEGLKS